MIIVMRTDASTAIGTGHVIRCLTLADRLQPYAEVVFVCQEHDGNLIDYIRGRGYAVHAFPPSRENWTTDADNTIGVIQLQQQPVDWMIVDHYGLDAGYESLVRPHVRRVMVIDDLADRMHRCDLLLDQNPYGNGDRRYTELVEPDTTRLLGPDYALLKPDFAKAKIIVNRTGIIRNVLVSFGGSDPTGETIKTLQALEQLRESATEKLRIKVLTGKVNARARQIQDLCEKLGNAECFEHVENVSALMSEADLAIGSGGTTTWERCCLGLPAIVIVTADNQAELSEYAARLGVIERLGQAAEVRAADIGNRVLELMQDPGRMASMSARGMKLVDGLGSDRVVKELLTC